MDTAGKVTPAKKLVSQLLQEDADLRDIVEEFVAGLTKRLDELKTAHQKLDFQSLTTFAHRLKGAAGSYGYPDISRVCAEMEQKFQANEADRFAEYLAQLANMTAAAQTGLENAV